MLPRLLSIVALTATLVSLPAWAATLAPGTAEHYLSAQQALRNGDHNRARRELELAANGGLVEAQLQLAKQLPAKRAEPWLRRAVRGGSLAAAESLAQLYYQRAAYRRAAQCWLLAAHSGRSQAQARLGALQVVGLGLPKDIEQAYAWLNLAASAGDADVISLRDGLESNLSTEQLHAAQRRSRELPAAMPNIAGEPACGE
ncbi:tetratricopeptide repeat protein [Atopomonas sediminilitoris]|uniref:tetratricopeptide repeat protein n=1 Tax=Atopomonas sediminilitoris TaxID=2919919 RepID=UPI001F4DCF54|nr:hypothetical protein [Atopomonas sediminilitoris]MCJ8167747.1 hypothetical protein [Atopomonas sediminilitoris]